MQIKRKILLAWRIASQYTNLNKSEILYAETPIIHIGRKPMARHNEIQEYCDHNRIMVGKTQLSEMYHSPHYPYMYTRNKQTNGLFSLYKKTTRGGKTGRKNTTRATYLPASSKNGKTGS